MYKKYDYMTQKITDIAPKEGQDFLKFAYEQIGCDYIDFAKLTETLAIVVDDEGLLKDNELLTVIQDTHAVRQRVVAGHFIFVTINLHTGETLPVSEKDIQYIEKALRIFTLPTFAFGGDE